MAIFKACELVGQLRRAGADVTVVMTRAAGNLVGPDLFRSLSGRPVATDLFGSALGSHPHVELANWADLVVVAPATANLLGKVASGIADDLLSTLVMAARSPIVLVPAMNVRMWENPVVQGNLEKLRERGYRIVEGESGWLACGEEGKGRMAEVGAIVEAVEEALGAPGDLAGLEVLITAGRTEEAIDAVRFISNRSSGRTGSALAEEASRRGARVVYISGATSVPPPDDVEVVPVATAAEMRGAVLEELPKADVLVMAAAVADYRPSEAHEGKLKKGADPVALTLVPTEDILTIVRDRRRPDQVMVGFALETQDEIGAGVGKLEEKGLDLVVVNNPVAPDSGFGKETVRAAILERGGPREELSLVTKRELARDLFDRVARLRRERG